VRVHFHIPGTKLWQQLRKLFGKHMVVEHQETRVSKASEEVAGDPQSRATAE
jgi:dephospho-CoA kinase